MSSETRWSALGKHSGGALLALIAGITCACGERASVGGPATRDSAGVRIVVYTDAALTTAPAWDLGAAPLLDLGGSDSAGGDQFHRVRSVVALPEGRVLVANAGTNELRIYDSTGRRVRTIGRSGSGPGEFRLLAWAVLAAGDSIVAYDPQLQRISVIDTALSATRTYALTVPSLRFPFARQRLSDGSILVAPEDAYTPASARGTHRDSLVLHRVDHAGRAKGVFLRLPGDDRFVLPEKRGVRSAPLAFGRSVVMASGDSTLYIGGTDEYEVRGLTLAGATRLILRVNRSARPVTGDLIDAYKRRELSRVEGKEWLSFFTAIYDSMSYPATMPHLSALRVDDRERLWVRDYPVHPDSTPAWRVFDAVGNLVAMVTVPASFDILTIAADRVLGVWRDENDVEHVRVYRLRRTGDS
jgi:hypothetical protein